MSSLRRNAMSGLGGKSNVALTRLARPSTNRNAAIRSLSEAQWTSRETRNRSLVTQFGSISRRYEFPLLGIFKCA
jgi:hypothetical protein